MFFLLHINMCVKTMDHVAVYYESWFFKAFPTSLKDSIQKLIENVKVLFLAENLCLHFLNSPVTPQRS